MFKNIQITKKYKSLVPFEWSNIPALAVISGINGAGKTQLMDLFWQAAQGNRIAGLLKFESDNKLAGRVKLVSPYHRFENIHVQQPGTVSTSETINQQLLKYIRSGGAGNVVFDSVIAKIEADLGRARSEISDQEISVALPYDFFLSVGDYFNNQYIADICRGYLSRQIAIEHATYGAPISKEDIVKRVGSNPPWEELNELFEKYGFSYRLNEPQVGIEYIPEFVSKNDQSVRLSFGELSDGERTIASLLFWGYNSHLGKKYDVFLLDEIDSHLNPSMAQMMMEVVRDRLVSDFGLQVVMTTHSPSTIAFAKDSELFWMAQGKPIRQSSRSEIVPILSNGIIAVTEDKASLRFTVEIGDSKRKILCVEGFTDKLILEEAWRRVKGNDEMPFDIFDMFDCHFIINAFKRGVFFANYPEKAFVGLIDFDQAHKDATEKFTDKEGKKVWERSTKCNSRTVYWLRKTELGAVTTLTVPAFRADYVIEGLKRGALSIELLFPDDVLVELCRDEPQIGGGSIKVFREEKKVEFAQHVVPSLEDSAFVEFATLFEHLDSLFLTLCARHP